MPNRQLTCLMREEFTIDERGNAHVPMVNLAHKILTKVYACYYHGLLEELLQLSTHESRHSIQLPYLPSKFEKTCH